MVNLKVCQLKKDFSHPPKIHAGSSKCEHHTSLSCLLEWDYLWSRQTCSCVHALENSTWTYEQRKYDGNTVTGGKF